MDSSSSRTHKSDSLPNFGVNTHVSQAPDQRVRRGRNEVTSKRSEDVMVMKSRRVHGDQKKKIHRGADEEEHQVSGELVSGLEVKTRRHDSQKNPRPE
jgi:hypothetical protein